MKERKMSSWQIKEKIQELELRWWQIDDRIDKKLQYCRYDYNDPEIVELRNKQSIIENDIYLIIDTVGTDEFVKVSIPDLCFN